MSSAGAHSVHINHVTTQLPYALTVAAICAVGYLAAGVIGYYTVQRGCGFSDTADLCSACRSFDYC